MNIVQTILDMLSGNVMDKLSSLIGESESKTQSAVGAAVPAILSGFSTLASGEQGAQKLAGTLSKIDAGALSNLGSMLSGGSADDVAEQGGSMLSSLLGGDTVTGLINAVARFAGLDGKAAKNLISYLGPLVLGGLAKQFAGKTFNAQSLMNFFSSQKANIAGAIPSNLSLSEIPGLEAAHSTVTTTYGSAKNAASPPAKSVLPWLLGLAALALILFFLWRTIPSQSTEVAELTNDVKDAFSSLSDTLAGIKDAASADAALPALTEVGSKVSGMRVLIEKLPAAAKANIAALIKPGLDKLEDQLNRVLMIPGAGAKLRSTLERVVDKLAQLGGLKAEDFSLPSQQVTEVGSSLSAVLASLTESLTGVQDAASADAALPKLQELNGQLDRTTADWEELPADGKATIRSVIKSTLTMLTDLMKKVLAIPGVSDQFKPAAEEILHKLTTFGA